MPRFSRAANPVTPPKQVIRQPIAVTPHGIEIAAARGAAVSWAEADGPRSGPLNSPVEKEIQTMMTNEKPYCQMAGCGSTTEVRAIEVDLVDAWEASPRFTTIAMHVALCASCACEAERRVEAMLQARTEFHDLLAIITAAVGYEKAQALKLDSTEAEVERLELELGAARKTLRDTEAELRLAKRQQERAFSRHGWPRPSTAATEPTGHERPNRRRPRTVPHRPATSVCRGGFVMTAGLAEGGNQRWTERNGLQLAGW